MLTMFTANILPLMPNRGFYDYRCKNRKRHGDCSFRALVTPESGSTGRFILHLDKDNLEHLHTEEEQFATGLPKQAWKDRALELMHNNPNIKPKQISKTVCVSVQCSLAVVPLRKCAHMHSFAHVLPVFALHICVGVGGVFTLQAHTPRVVYAYTVCSLAYYTHVPP
jgi:hypothetical protein